MRELMRRRSILWLCSWSLMAGVCMAQNPKRPAPKAPARTTPRVPAQRPTPDPGAQPATGEPRALQLNQPIKLSITGGQTQVYQINLTAAQFAQVEVVPQAITLIVSISAPDGKVVAAIDGKDARLWRPTISCVARTSGAYRFEVKAYGLKTRIGRYTLKLAEQHTANAADFRRVLTEALSLAKVCDDLRSYESAAGHYEQALVIAREIKDRSAEAETLTGLGNAYKALNQNEKAAQYYQQVLAISRVKDRNSESSQLMTLGNARNDAGEYEQAAQYYEQALVIRRELKDRTGESNTLMNLGIVYTNLHQYKKAAPFFDEALTIKREVKDRSGEGSVLMCLGIVYKSLGQYEQAAPYYELALAIAREVKDRLNEADTLNNLMGLYLRQNKPGLAAFYGKQAVNIYQEIRGSINPLNKESERTFVLSNENTYRRLARILISAGRLPEAQVVLDLLKEEEFSLGRRSGAPADGVPYGRTESEALKVVEELAALGREYGDLLKKQSASGLQPDETEQLKRLNEKIIVANREWRRTLEALANAEASTQNRVEDVNSGQPLMDVLDELGPGTVALYTIIVTETEQPRDNSSARNQAKVGWIILVTPTTRKAYPIDVNNLEQTVFRFREALQTDAYDALPLARQLYRMLFLQTSEKQKTTLAADLETYLARSEQKTLMWSLDGVLRYVPMAALHDGRQYLIERYRNTVFNKFSIFTLKDPVSEKWTALGLGVTEPRVEEGRRFPGLRGAERELRSIIRERGAQTSEGILPGAIELNQAFTRQSMIEGLSTGYKVVHIASHFSFNSAEVGQSFLLLGKDHLSVADMRDLANPFAKVELLTLSACDTAMGSANGKEVEGFAYTAQTLGAKAVIASLWPVSDEGTDELMTRFYRFHRDNPQMPKGEALRQAQLSLLRGDDPDAGATATTKRTAERVDTVGATAPGAATTLRPFKPNPNARYSHPFYWAPFILIGNWK